jgi:hypothetical protein
MAVHIFPGGLKPVAVLVAMVMVPNQKLANQIEVGFRIVAESDIHLLFLFPLVE